MNLVEFFINKIDKRRSVIKNNSAKENLKEGKYENRRSNHRSSEDQEVEF